MLMMVLSSFLFAEQLKIIVDTELNGKSIKYRTYTIDVEENKVFHFEVNVQKNGNKLNGVKVTEANFIDVNVKITAI
jgi:hypothetical protein